MQFHGKLHCRPLAIFALLAAIIGGGAYGWYVWLPRRIATSERNNLPGDPNLSGRCLVLNPTEEAMANNMGVGFAAKGEYDQAIACFRMAVSRKDDYLPGWKNLLAALVESERWPEALQAAEKAEELHPLRAELRSEEPPPSASSGQAPSTGPGRAPSTGLGQAPSASSGQGPSAGSGRMPSTGSGQAPSTSSGRATSASSGQMPDARSQLIQDKDFLANLARAYLEGGQLEKARSRFMLYVRLFPQELRGYNGLGEVAFREGDYDRAVQLFAQSLKLYGDQPEVAARLREIAEKAGPSTDSGQALAEKVQWVLASYLEPRGKRPGTPAADPFAPTPAPLRQQLPIPTREPAVELPKAPVPDLD